MRLFIAFELNPVVRRALVDACTPFHPLAQNCTWYKADKLHVTIAFLGDAAPSFLKHLTHAIDTVCGQVEPIPCRVAGFGFYGSRRYPSVLWAGVEPAAVIETLHDRLWHALGKLGYEKPSAPFDPHITLARCESRTRNAALLEALDVAPADDFVQWTAAGVTLFESRLSPRGAVYCTLHRAVFGRV